MTDEEKRLVKRLSELSNRAETRWVPCYSDFLTLAEQTLLPYAVPGGGYTLAGGYEGAERRLACFGENAAEEAPIACLCFEPASRKFAEALGHRDYLGALMSLGLKREKLGDILVVDGSAWLFCLPAAAELILSELDRVRHTAVRVTSVTAPPEAVLPQPQERELVVASERLDAVIAGVYKLSRSESQKLFPQGLVFVNGGACPSPSHALSEGDIVSVRGRGRFVYQGVSRDTRKGRLRVGVSVY